MFESGDEFSMIALKYWPWKWALQNIDIGY